MPITKKTLSSKDLDSYGFGEGAEMDEALFEAMPDDGAIPDGPTTFSPLDPIIQMRGV